MEKYEKQEIEISKIKTEFGQFKKDVYEKLEEIFEELRKPLFSDKQIYSLIITLVVYLIFTVNYISGNNYRSLQNKSSLKTLNIKHDKIMDILILIKEDVAEIKGKQQ